MAAAIGPPIWVRVKRPWWTVVETVRSIIASIGIDQTRGGGFWGHASSNHDIVVDGVRVVVRRCLVVVLWQVGQGVLRSTRLWLVREVVLLPARLIRESRNVVELVVELVAGLVAQGDALGVEQLGEWR